MGIHEMDSRQPAQQLHGCKIIEYQHLSSFKSALVPVSLLGLQLLKHTIPIMPFVSDCVNYVPQTFMQGE